MENYKNILSMRVRNAKWFFLFFNLIFKCLEFFLNFFLMLVLSVNTKKSKHFHFGIREKNQRITTYIQSPRYGNNEI